MKGHTTVDAIFLPMLKGFPDHDRSLLLSWMSAVKRSLNKVNGSGPNQLVFGRDPGWPGIVGYNPKLLQGDAESETSSNILGFSQKMYYGRGEGGWDPTKAMFQDGKMVWVGYSRTVAESQPIDWLMLCFLWDKITGNPNLRKCVIVQQVLEMSVVRDLK